MEAKEFQTEVLDTFGTYLELLTKHRLKAADVERVRRENPDIEVPEYPFDEKAWDELRTTKGVPGGRAYCGRIDALGRRVPNITFKIPTGGGKTFLAVQSLTKLISTQFEEGEPRFVLWIVPSEAIFSQTKRSLEDRESPLRKSLDTATGNRVKLLTKESALHYDDAESYLCIMLLMLPSANRAEPEKQLRFFRDRGNVNGFLPPEDNQPAHDELVRAIPNLDYVRMVDALTGEETEKVGIVKSSMGNALRLLRPIVILDEGHKAVSDKALATINGFNPRFVLELTATPKSRRDGTVPNLLVDVPGKALQDEEMIKLPIELTVTGGDDWKNCLSVAWQQLEALSSDAEALRMNENRYIRPILLVQVERTGSDQRESGFIHAEDVREQLVQLGLDDRSIAVKSSEKDDLKDLENRNLLDPANPIRAIITRQALQEGWDCSFAYVLCALATSRSESGMTQLVGRILRQPDARSTGVQSLDRCYVFTFRQESKDLIEKIRRGLENEGLADLANQIVGGGGRDSGSEAKVINRPRRPGYVSREFYLPQVLIQDPVTGSRLLDWETDILGKIEWVTLKVLPPPDMPRGSGDFSLKILVGLKDWSVFANAAPSVEFDRVFAIRNLVDIIPNPWIAGSKVDEFISALRDSGWDEKEIGEHARFVLEQLMASARMAVDDAAQEVYERGLDEGRIVFQLVADRWWRLPQTSPAIEGDRIVADKTMFPPAYASELNGLELKAATFLDRDEAVGWYYRNVVRGNGYGLQGWRKKRIYPDFLVACEKDGELERWVVIETKGNHLDNPETAYKQAVFDRLQDAYQAQGELNEVGQMTLWEHRTPYRCAIVMESNLESDLNRALGAK